MGERLLKTVKIKSVHCEVTKTFFFWGGGGGIKVLIYNKILLFWSVCFMTLSCIFAVLKIILSN